MPFSRTLSYFSAFFFAVLFPLLAVTPGFGGDATVLIYHRFDEQRYPTTNVSQERFREQLLYLREHNYQVIPLARLVGSLKTGTPLPDKAVVITIDDGYKSVYEKAWPELKAFGYPFTVFLYTKATENRHWDYMTWAQVKELQAAGVDFQDHGYAHNRMANLPPAMPVDQYLAWIEADLVKSRELFAERLGTAPQFFAIPYGEYNRQITDKARAIGYEGVFTQDPGSVSEHTDPYMIPREPILGNDWASMAHFKEVLERVDLPISRMAPDIVPFSGNTPPPAFSARLLNPEQYIPETLGIYVSELGWQQATVKNDQISIVNPTKLTRRLNRVAVSAREKESGRTAIRFWFFVNQAVAPEE